MQNIKVVLNGQGIDEIFGGTTQNLLLEELEKINPDGKIYLNNEKIYKKSLLNSIEKKITLKTKRGFNL